MVEALKRLKSLLEGCTLGGCSLEKVEAWERQLSDVSIALIVWKSL